MKTVFEKLPATAFLLGEQPVDKATVYRRASFCVVTKVGDTYIAYNTLTKELAELDLREADALEAESVIFSPEYEQLIRGYFLVPQNHDDKKLCDGVTVFARSAYRGSAYRRFTVFTTTDCNARCFYCYERGIKHMDMCDDTARRVADFIVRASEGEAVSITWYGGEPLMNTSAMDIISSALSAAGVEYTSMMATNASLFDDALIKKAVDLWHTDRVQITLDGTREVYDRIKAYSDRESGFEMVLSNIQKLLDCGIKVNIRLNVGGHNIADMHALTNLLADRFGGRRGLNVYAALLFDECEWASRGSTDCDRYELAKEIIKIEDIAAERGILHPKKLYRTVSHCFCKADAEDALVITAEGKIVKCDFFTDSRFVGDVESGIDEEKLQDSRLLYSRRIECGGCMAYPICLRLAACPTGGCDDARKFMTEERLVRSVRYLYASAREKR
ncbi:MAG: radical SAM protein [Clostridia bacterium]|nr:radical SAM protein [Clostridia bacterium]